MKSLIEKYNIAAPRYTSYPTVPYWEDVAPTQQQWKEIVKDTFVCTNQSEGISLYIHLPYCESLCTYCGCNTRITVNHGVELPYILALLNEWSLYLDVFEEIPRIKEIHIGGGTPTFFKPENLQLLLDGILSTSVLCANAEMSFEGHPNNTTEMHLQTLYDKGFRRVSFGIQDFDHKVQDIIHRIQSYEAVKRVTEHARKIGYTSVNYDLIYGLPLQTEKSMQETIRKVIELHPDRIAFYSYAHVPWIKRGQRKFTEDDLPVGEVKRKLYENGRDAFQQAGYVEIGMDHFAMPNDQLHIAEKKKELHRNFMGYTTSHTQLLVGLGVSSISDGGYGFAQNEKTVEEYYKRISQGEIPLFRGHIFTREDLILRNHILNIMCRLETSWEDENEQCKAVEEATDHLKEMEEDGLLSLSPFNLKVTSKGKPYLRNICMAFDARLWRKQPATRLFSTTA